VVYFVDDFLENPSEEERPFFLTLVTSFVLVGCGAHHRLIFVEADAERAEDDHIEISVTYECGTTGYDDCGDVTPHCLVARWFAVDGLPEDVVLEDTPKGKIIVGLNLMQVNLGEPVLTEEVCQTRTLKRNEQATLVLRTAAPVSADEELVIELNFEDPSGTNFENAVSLYVDDAPVLRNP
jgi:hypothetical protein